MFNNSHQPPNYPPTGYNYPPQPPPSQQPDGQLPWAPQYGTDGGNQPRYQSQQPDWHMQQQQQQQQRPHPHHPQPSAGPSSGYHMPPAYQDDNIYPPQPPSNISRPTSSNFRSSFSPHQSTSENITPESASAEGKGQKPKSGSQKKRKRGKEDGVASPSNDGPEKEKRTKTGRACDACRTKKIRCDILPADEVDGHGQPICAHCKQYGLECTFFLPITETRFKKRRATGDTEPPPQPTDNVQLGNSILASDAALEAPPPREVPDRIEGPTSLSFLLHTSLPASASEAYDLREHSKWEVLDDGNGVIRISDPPDSRRQANGDPDNPSNAHNRLNKPILSTQIMSLLVNAYFNEVAHMFPIISRQDFASRSSPSPFLLYAICGLGATRRQFPREVFAAVRGVINGLLRSNDILSDARFENVQALLLLSQVGDLHAQPTAATASASLIRMGAAVRMAQDLGLHRESTTRAETVQDLAFVELRRRVWATCVIFDRWYASALGIPQLVDILDCDVLLPAPYDIIPDQEPATWPINTNYLALAEHLKLSILIGRTLKTHYSPSGLTHTTDAQLESLFADITNWRENLPEELKFQGPSSPLAAGLLHMAHAALQFLFWRVFMRITYRCPPHLTIRLTLECWNSMVKWSSESIQWLHENDEALDTLFIYPYTATSCALIQYHTWARRRSDQALEMLQMIKDTAIRWEKIVQPDQMSIRRKTCETMTLLYEAALKTNPELEEPKDRPAHINPTVGVEPRNDVGRVVWVKDASRKGGGVYVASNEEDRQDAGVPLRECILASDLVPGSDQARQFAMAKNQNFGRSTHEDNGWLGRTSQDQGGNEILGSALSTNEALTREREQYEAGTAPNAGHASGHAQGLADGKSQTGQKLHQNEDMAKKQHMTPPSSSQPTSHEAMGHFQEMHNSANLNPHMNNAASLPVHGEQNMGHVEMSDSMDFGVLDGLPMASFDFPSWEQYFMAINSGDGYGLF